MKFNMAEVDERVESILRTIYEISKENKAEPYLVGGYLRDMIIQNMYPCEYAGTKKNIQKDLDIALSSNSKLISRKFADHLNGAFVPLDIERNIYRVVIKDNEVNFQIDFSNFKGDCITEDLLARDFSINAPGISLYQLLESGSAKIIDPQGGIDDIKNKIIRTINPVLFEDDSLRLLRAIRFSSQLKFKISRETRKFIKSMAILLAKCSRERIRDEFFLIIDSPKAFFSIKSLDNLNLLNVIIPEIEELKDVRQDVPHSYDLWEHSLKTVKHCENILDNVKKLPLPIALKEKIDEHLNQEVEFNISRKVLLKFCCFLHDTGKKSTSTVDESGRIRFFEHEKIGAEKAKVISRRLKLSHDSVNIIFNIIKNHMKPLNLFSDGPVTKRAKYRLFRDSGENIIDILLLSMADVCATSGISFKRALNSPYQLFIYDLLRSYDENNVIMKENPLLSGNEVMRTLKIPQGSEVGRILKQLKEAMVLEIVKNKEEAVKFILSLK